MICVTYIDCDTGEQKAYFDNLNDARQFASDVSTHGDEVLTISEE